MNTAASKPVAVVVGAGPGNGLSITRRFSQAGYRTALLARDLDKTRRLADGVEDAAAYACDVADPKSVDSAFNAIRADLGEVDVLIYNAGSGVFASFEDIDAQAFEQSWRVNALGAFLCAKQVTPAMSRKGHGAFILIGATASRRGGIKTVAFAPAKAAQRSLAESVARSFWPKGIHVALIVVDGIVDIETTRKNMPNRPEDSFVDPDGVAEIAYTLTQQSPRAWSFEVEARPAKETW